MSVRVHHHRFLTTGLGALGIIAANVLKHTSEQLGVAATPFSKLGAAIFVISWTLVAYSVAMDNKGGFSPSLKALVVFASVAGIIYSVFSIKRLKDANAPEMMIQPFIILFIVSWLLFGVTIGLGRNNTAYMLGVLGAVAVILSVVYALPWQRMNGIVDGPGPYLYSLGWLLVAFGNSIY